MASAREVVMGIVESSGSHFFHKMRLSNYVPKNGQICAIETCTCWYPENEGEII